MGDRKLSASLGVYALWGFVLCSLRAAQGIASGFRALHFMQGGPVSSKHRELPAWTSLYRRAEFFFLGMGGGSYIGPFGRYDSTKTTYETLSFDDIESAIRRKHPEWPVQKIKRSATERLANRERKMHGEQSRAEYASPEMYFQADGYVQFLVQLSQISEVVLMLDNGSDPEGDAIETLCKNSQRVLASDLSREHILFARSWSPLVVATA